jgi:hypothetical protein
MVCQRRKGAAVDIEDVSRVYSLFVDVKRSTQYLIEYQEQFMFNEGGLGCCWGWGVAGVPGDRACVFMEQQLPPNCWIAQAGHPHGERGSLTSVWMGS